MVTLKFVFNEDKVREAGLTVDIIMQPIRNYMTENGAEEIDKYKFQSTEPDANGMMLALIVNITKKDHDFIHLLDEWIFDSDGEIEDCIKETKEWYQENGIQYIA